MAQITNKLLKQAIADAEAVRETAVANAKLVLEEAITPQIRDMISRRLRVEAEMGEEDEEMEKKDDVKTEAAKELPHEDGEAEGSSEFPADSSDIGMGDNKESSDDSFDSSEIGDGGENVSDSSTDWYDDWSESDFDLDEVIKELENDIAALSAKNGEEEGEEEMKDEASQETYASDVSKYAKAPVHEEDEEEEATHSVAKGGMEKTAEMEKDMKDEEEVDLEEILAELEAEEDEMGAETHDDDKKEMAAEIARLKNEMAQYKEAFNMVRSRLHEVNLLNAKLLFTNKMFRKEGLSNEQKVRIVESFDRATTVREVKLVFTALVENLSTAAKTFNTSRKKVVTEGFASKATPSTAPKKKVIVENAVAKRLQELAGII